MDPEGDPQVGRGASSAARDDDETARSRRRPPTAQEAKALAHPMRQRIVRLCMEREHTNRQLADAIGSDPGTVLPHVRMLVEAGFVSAAAARTGSSGALEKPYRATGKTWWLDDPLSGQAPDVRFGPLEMALDDARAAARDSIATYGTFLLHLDDDDVAELDRRILDVLDEFIASEPSRSGRPIHRGVFAIHTLRTEG